MPIEYRPAQPSEYAAVIDAMSTAFLERPDVERVALGLQRDWEDGRCWAAFDGDRVVGTFRSWATELTVPGGALLPAAAVSGVTVLPTHRRRGILRGLAAGEHGAIRERGEAVGLLYASEYPIYGRFGYGPAIRNGTWTVNARRASFRGSVPGGVELVPPGEGAAALMRDVFDRMRVGRAGEIRRRDFTWRRRLGLDEEPWGDRWKGFLVVRRDASGVPDGYARYAGEPKWTDGLPSSRVVLNELVAATDDAYTALWGYLLAMDLVGTVVAEDRPESERLPWLLVDARAAVQSDVRDGLWVRLFDVPRALAARTYTTSASLVLEVLDDELAGGSVRLHLDASPDGADCAVTTRDPDLSIPVAALGAAYLGGTRLRDAVLWAGVEEHRAGALPAADELFRTVDPPACSTFF